MAVTALVALTTARTLLNDDAASLWTDVALIPKLQQAFRELEAKLRINAASIMRKTVVNNVSAHGTTYTALTDIIEPIRLWEKAVGDPDTSYVQMTEQDPLANNVEATTLIYWQWDGALINFIGASANRTVKLTYWRTLAEPAASSDSLFFINAELYLAPRTAALAAGSVGEKDKFEAMTAVAEGNIELVIQANRGRQAPSQGMGTARP